jgi:hypothetical protein
VATPAPPPPVAAPAPVAAPPPQAARTDIEEVKPASSRRGSSRSLDTDVFNDKKKEIDRDNPWKQ